MRLRTSRKSLAALAILCTAVACCLYTVRSPPRPLPPEPRCEFTADPTAPVQLPLSLLARLQRIPSAGARNLFAFVDPPPVPTPHPTPASSSIANSSDPIRAAAVQDRSPYLTFYGYVSARSRPLRAFFSDGNEIYIRSEGELFAGRYRVIHIDAAAAVIEDTSANRRHTLTLDAS